MENKQFVNIPYFEVVLQFPVVKIHSKNETHTTLSYRAWGVESTTTVPNDWVK